jgi:hypothetical protein
MNARDARAVVNRPVSTDLLARVEHPFELGRRSGSSGWENRRRAATRMSAVGNADAFSGAIHIVGAVASVDVQVDISRRDVIPFDDAQTLRPAPAY